MLSTTDHDLHYPGPDDFPNAPKQIEQLAEDTEAALAALIQDSGVRTDISVTPESGWAVAAKSYRTVGKTMELRLSITRNAGDITAVGSGSTPGNIADMTIATIGDATKRPTMDTFGEFRAAITGGSCQVNSDGGVVIADAHAGSTIREGDAVTIHATYPIP